MSFTPTEEQAQILDCVKNSSQNIIIHALAGAAKTSTLVLIDKALPSVPKLALCFNVRIKEEMAKRFSGTVTTLTLNSLGHRVWGQSTARRLIVEKDKVHNKLYELIKAMPFARQGEAFESFSDIKRAIAHGKLSGWIPDSRAKGGHFAPLKSNEEFFEGLEFYPSEIEEELLLTASEWSVDQAMQGTIDYDDQVLLPTVFRGSSFPSYPLVLVDEAQDLSALNHAMLRKLVRKRVIAVGDEYQSIYGFRGAHQDSMDLLGRTFSMRRFGLSISFRCPELVVREAHFRAPNMRPAPNAKAGRVLPLAVWGIEDIPDEATILCRNNAPLFSMAIALLKAGRYPELVGNDIGKNLIKVMEKMGKPDVSKEKAMFGLDSWREDKLKKARDEDAKAKIEDQYSCLKIFLDMGRTLGDAITYAKHLLTVGGPVKLMTGHKAKGLEWDNVFLLDVHLVRMEFTQDRNLKYVMQTRSKDTLYYVRSEDFDLGVRLPDKADDGSSPVEGDVRAAARGTAGGPDPLLGDIQL